MALSRCKRLLAALHHKIRAAPFYSHDLAKHVALGTPSIKQNAVVLQVQNFTDVRLEGLERRRAQVALKDGVLNPRQVPPRCLQHLPHTLFPNIIKHQDKHVYHLLIKGS